VGVFVSNTLPQCLHIGNRRNTGLDQSIIRCFETLLGWEFLVTLITNRRLLHLYCPPSLDGRKKQNGRLHHITVLGHRVLEPLAKRILALLELVDFLLEVLADAFDARKGLLASERRLRSIVAVRL